MRIEVLCTGDELLTGVTADTNSPFFMARLLRLGERVSRTTIVGDDRAAIRDALKECAARADLLLVSGGLGPTADDVTAEAAAEAAGAKLIEDAGTLERMRQRFAQRGIALTPNNRRQARVPEGAEVEPNEAGSAPFFAVRLGKCLACFVPGVPREYRHLVETQVLPRVAKLRAPGASAFAFRILKTVGLPESHLDARVAPLAQKLPEVIFGFRTEAPENHLELLARAATQRDADALLAEVERESRKVLGDFVFGADDDTLAGVVVASLKSRGETVVATESCTGGLVSAALTAVPGASSVFPGAAVTYASELKSQFADVPPSLIAEKGEVSAEVARAMAEGLRARTRATWSVSITGYAGPSGGDEREPVGAVYIAVAGPDGTTHQRHVFAGDRDRVRTFATGMALDAVRRRLFAKKNEETSR